MFSVERCSGTERKFRKYSAVAMIVVGFFLFSIFGAGVTNASVYFNNKRGAFNYHLTTPELARNWGCDTEEHEVTTDDGYIFSIFRIKRKGENEPLGRNVVLLESGFASSSDHFFSMEEEPLVLKFMEYGFDLWLGNVRGCRYGKKHKYKSVMDVDFWDFSWHEIAVYDLPATIDYILDKTNTTKLVYGGYSAGTTIFYALMSKRPEYNDKVAIAVILAPVVYWYHAGNIWLDTIARMASPLYEFAMREKLIDLLELGGPAFEFMKSFCSDPKFFSFFCRPVVVSLAGITDDRQSDENVRRFIMYMTTSGFKQVVHYAQVYSSGKFREYKYPTASANLLKYGSEEPPEYNISSARVPTVIIAAPNDRLATVEDINILVKATPNLLFYEVFPYQYYGHFSIGASENASAYFNQLTPILKEVVLKLLMN